MNSTNNKSILIFSNVNDFSTSEVIKWLELKNQKYYLISSISDFHKYNICLNEDYALKNVAAVWYRKMFASFSQIETENNELKNSTQEFLLSELKYFYFGVEKIFKNVKSLGNGFTLMDLNKIEVLIEAKKLKLNIPDFLLTTNKKELLEFKNRHSNIITKPIYNAVPIIYSEEKKGLMYTSLVDDDVINKLPDEFFPSFFQEYISKDYELRFSQANDNRIDYRNKEKNNNLMVSYKLPFFIKNQLNKLMRNLKLNTGSIDILKSKTGHYYFLEINPCGQYEGVSTMCNYQLNKKIAEWLINLKKMN
jgi:hypothetical protein